MAADCDGQPPRRERAPLGSRPEPATLKRWLRRWTKVRHREAAERTLLTAIAEGLSPAALADALLSAATERAFADDGHPLDFINKAFECLDLIGWEHAVTRGSKFLRVDDVEIVGDGRRELIEPLRHGLRRKQRMASAKSRSWRNIVVGDVLVHHLTAARSG